jgi:hypothetical protein
MPLEGILLGAQGARENQHRSDVEAEQALNRGAPGRIGDDEVSPEKPLAN